MKWINLACLLIFSASLLSAQLNQCEKEAKQVIEQFLIENPIPGLAISVAQRGKIVWSEGFGYSDVENKSPVNPYSTKFRIGSISKPITAAALGRLYDQQKVDLNAKVQEYVPDFPVKQKPITVAQVAGHISGIRHYRGLEFLNTTRYRSVTAGLEIFADDPLLFEPGWKYSYSSYGWNLISAIIEEASGVPFLSYVQSEVFDRLDMQESTADYHEKIIEGRTSFYARNGEQIINAPFVDNSYKWAGGGFLSSAVDICKFALGHLSGQMMDTSTFNLWCKSQQTNDGKETGYGIGWRNAKDADGDQWVGHSGGSVGGTSMMLCYPDRSLVVVILTNLSQAGLQQLPFDIASLFKGSCP